MTRSEPASRPDQTRSRDQQLQLGEVMMQVREPLLRFIKARGAGADADDVFQELWIKLRGKSSSGIADPVSYLFRCCDNLIIDLHRAETRRHQREASHGEPAGQIDASNDVEREIAIREELASVESVLANLGSRTCHVFRRYRIDGVGQREIAAELSISLSAVEKHLQKAYRVLAALRRRLDAE